MGNKEYSVIELIDVLRRYQHGDKIRQIEKATGIARNTIRKYLRISQKLGFNMEIDEELHLAAQTIFEQLHNLDSNNNKIDKILSPHKKLIYQWVVEEELTITKIFGKLQKIGLEISYSSLYRFIHEEFGFNSASITLRMAESKAGEAAEVDFGRLGFIQDSSIGKKRLVYALVVTLLYSRYQYVYVSHSQDLKSFICGIEGAWEFFGGVTKRLVIDNLKSAVIHADRYEPVFQKTFLEYSQQRGFIIDPAVVRHPQGKATVERQIHYVRANFFKGENFEDLRSAQGSAIKWCIDVAGMRVHGTTKKKPRIVFEEEEKKTLLPLSGQRFDVPKWGSCKVHRDHHIRFGNALYSIGTEYIGKTVEVRAE